MFSIVSLIVLAAVAWFGFRMYKRNADANSASQDPLDHDRGGVNTPIPGQRAATGGEVHDAARSHVGGHLEEHPDGVPARDGALDGTDLGGADDSMHRVEASVRTQPEPSAGAGSVTDGFGDSSEKVTVPGSPDPAAGGRPDIVEADGSLDADAAARAADASRDTGGTGAAVLAGIATAAAAGSATASSEAGNADDANRRDADPERRANAPDPDTAGTLDVEAARRASDAGTLDSGDAGAGGSGTAARPSGERDPVRDDAATNAPIGDTSASAAAREPLAPAAADTAGGASSPTEAPEPADRVNAPDADLAGTGGLPDRSNDERSNLVAGTVSLGLGGATAAPGTPVLEDGRTPAEQVARLGAAADLPSDTDRLANGDARSNVREMLQILNLRESDASRLGISDEDFGRLRRGEADDALVDDVGPRLHRMLG